MSLALARALDARKLVATSYESLNSLLGVYGPNCTQTLSELKELGARVQHGVDAGCLATTLSRDALPSRGFDRLIWNFPCIARTDDGQVLADAVGADGRGSVEANRALVARFCAGAAALLAPGGELHLTHKVGLQQWDIPDEGVAAGAGRLIYAGAVIFDRAAYAPYRPRKALAKKGFPTTDARTFVFVRVPVDGDAGDREDRGASSSAPGHSSRDNVNESPPCQSSSLDPSAGLVERLSMG